MKVLYATPECAPLTKTGGLGDVSAALPEALRAQGVEVYTFLPGYGEVLQAIGRTRALADLSVLGFECRLLHADDFVILACPVLYERDGGPYLDAHGRDYEDNALRFGVFARAAALLGGARSPLDWRPDVLHCHDWPTGLAPTYLREEPQRAASVMTIHNLAFQGNFEASLLSSLEIPAGAFTLDGVEFWGRISFLKGGIAYADAVTTVSPTYAREIRTPELGCGLDGLLRHRQHVLTGILNGIDTSVWDPAHDSHLEQRYDAGSLELKRRNKAALQRRMGLPVEPDVPLFGIVSRFTHQKGIDLVAAAADALAALPAQLVAIGTGTRDIETSMSAAARRNPQRMAVKIGFDEALAHAIEAGADAFLMPSRFEPCGLNQMYSQRYGTPPVARATGGLVDTVEDGVTGFLFSEDLVDAARRATTLFTHPERWQAMQRAGMTRDFGWPAAARRYADLYQRVFLCRGQEMLL
jgi:starch synthase